MQTIKPFVKWAGGKIRIIEDIKANLPSFYNRYFEPFLGGGSVLFSLQPSVACVNDINPFLINAYTQIRDNCEQVIARIKELQARQDKWAYLLNREKFNTKQRKKALDAEACALFVYLNKTCFNGLYRENGKGLFNVAWGGQFQYFIFEEDNIREVSRFLQNVCIYNMDFEPFCSEVKSEDFVYFDSPYVALNDTANFNRYTKEAFTEQDHRRLFSLYRRLDRLGAKLMLSNHDTEFIRKLYADYRINEVKVWRTIGQSTDFQAGEVIVTNY